MRYPAGKIKDAVLHPDPEVRSRAVGYFARAYSDDASIMAQVVRAVETYGRDEAGRLVGPARDLKQTDESVAWILGELDGAPGDADEVYTDNLSAVLAEADAALLRPREAAVLAALSLKPEARQAVVERLEMLSWDEATCWRELEALGDAAGAASSTDEVDLDRGRRIVEALARHAGACEAKVLDLLGREAPGDDEGAAWWMELLTVQLAGLARLDAAVPAIVARLKADRGDLLNEECARALTRIGSPAVVRAVAEAFPGAPESFRLYACGPLEDTHSDLAVEACVDLLSKESSGFIRRRLADALLSQFAPEGVEAARRLLAAGKLDFEGRGLRRRLLENCALTGERFPEYDEWLAADRADHEAHLKRIEELQDDPQRLLLYALETLTGRKAPEVSQAKTRKRPAPPSARAAASPRPLEPPRRPGRNDPCPCGSGKKYKACCGRS